MNKSTKIIKRLLALFLVVLMSINSFGAIVSENDGSAFVTKAEFDALKATFDSQIDKYNTSLDNKIDGAIASYLAGVRLNNEPENYFTLLKQSLGTIRFLNSVKTTESAITTNEILNVSRHYYQTRYTGMTSIYPAAVGNASDLVTAGFYYTMSTALVVSGTASAFSDSNSSTYLFLKQKGDWSNYHPWNQWELGVEGSWTRTGTQTGLGTRVVRGTEDKQMATDGQGKVYLYRTTPLGRLVLEQYCDNFYPVCELNVYGHSVTNYATNFWTNYTGSNLQRDVTSLECTVGSTELTTFGKRGTGTPYDTNYNGANGTRWSAQVYKTVTGDGINYDTAIWGFVPTENIFCIDKYASLTQGTTKTSVASETQTTIKGEDWGSIGGMVEKDVTLSGVKVTYTPPKLTSEAKSISAFCNDYVSTIAGETVYHGQGIKIAEAFQDGEVECKLKFKYEHSENAPFKLIWTDGKVGAPGTNVFINWETINCNGSTTVTKTIDFPSKGDLWINCYSDTSGLDLILDDVQFEPL